MDKILTFQTQNEKGVFLYTIGEGRDHEYLTKTASQGFHTEIQKYIDQAQKMEGKTQLLLTALGAYEYWGQNINGDGFPVAALSHVGQDYGYKTFEHYAKIYKHHVNKDPAKSYGDVALSVWNEKMKRVELIVILDNAKAPDLVERIDNGEYPEVSMGTKVPYDVCSICGNKAKTRAQYCDHLRYHMNKIPPGYSKIAYAINTMPRFFDISFVLIGADRIARVMKKVAHLHPQFGVSSAEAAEKERPMEKIAYGLSRSKIAARKTAEIEKEIPSNVSPNTIKKIEDIGSRGVEALQPLEKDIPKRTIIIISSINSPGPSNLNRVLSTLGMLGIMPKPREFQQIALRSLGKGSMADDFERKGYCFENGSYPSERQQRTFDNQINIGHQNFDPHIFDLIKSILPDRSYVKPLLHKRVIKLVKLAEEGKLNYPKTEHVKTAMFDKDPDDRNPIGVSTVMLTIAGLYMAMKKKTPEATMSGMDKLISTNPGVAAALGIGTITGLNALFAREVKGKYDLHPDHKATPSLSWQQDIMRKNQSPITKTGGLENLKSLGRRLMFGVPAVYIGSESLRQKRARNPYQQESTIGKTIRKYPDLIGLGIAGEAIAGRPITKGISKGLKRGLSFLSKRASISDDLKSTAIYSLAFPGSSLAVRGTAWAIDQGIMSGIEKLLKHKGSKPRGGNYA